MTIKILLFVLLCFCGYHGLKHFGVIGDNTPKEVIREEKKKTTKLPKPGINTRNARGQVKNISSALPQDIQSARRNQLQGRFPNVDNVLGSDSSRWLEVLNEEDFTILRELRNKLNLNQDITEDDLKYFVMLENRQVIRAIKENRPDILKADNSRRFQPEPEPSYDEPRREDDYSSDQETFNEPRETFQEEAPVPDEAPVDNFEEPIEQNPDAGLEPDAEY